MGLIPLEHHSSSRRLKLFREETCSTRLKDNHLGASSSNNSSSSKLSHQESLDKQLMRIREYLPRLFSSSSSSHNSRPVDCLHRPPMHFQLSNSNNYKCNSSNSCRFSNNNNCKCNSNNSFKCNNSNPSSNNNNWPIPQSSAAWRI